MAEASTRNANLKKASKHHLYFQGLVLLVRNMEQPRKYAQQLPSVLVDTELCM